MKAETLRIWMSIFNITIILLSMFSMIWIGLHIFVLQEQFWFIIIESLITVFVLAEITLRIVIVGFRNFFRSCFNLFDSIASILCIAIVLLAAGLKNIDEGIEEEVALVLLSIRNILLLIKTCLVFRKKYQQSIIRHFNEMEEALIDNLEAIKIIYQANMDTLIEADEHLEYTQSLNLHLKEEISLHSEDSHRNFTIKEEDTINEDEIL